MARETLELLDSLMAGDRMTPAELDRLVQGRVGEDLYLDYKDGSLLENKTQAAAAIRRYLSGFANSAGGVLVIGVNSDTWRVTGCPAPGGGALAEWGRTLDEWASDCVQQLAPHFSPAPQFGVVEHENGDVLVAATSRSLSMVPCIEKGQFVYYLRFHDQTLKVPDYLISDLMLGRRQHANLHIPEVELLNVSRVSPGGASHYLQFDVKLTIENESLSWAEDTRLGIISWDSRDSKAQISKYLQAHVERLEPNQAQGFGNSHLRHSTYRQDLTIGPFDVEIARIHQAAWLPIYATGPHLTPYSWQE